MYTVAPASADQPCDITVSRYCMQYGGSLTKQIIKQSLDFSFVFIFFHISTVIYHSTQPCEFSLVKHFISPLSHSLLQHTLFKWLLYWLLSSPRSHWSANRTQGRITLLTCKLSFSAASFHSTPDGCFPFQSCFAVTLLYIAPQGATKVCKNQSMTYSFKFDSKQQDNLLNMQIWELCWALI